LNDLLNASHAYLRESAAATIKNTGGVKAMAHNHRGGLPGKTFPACACQYLRAIDLNSWHSPAVFNWPQEQGNGRRD